MKILTLFTMHLAVFEAEDFIVKHAPIGGAASVGTVTTITFVGGNGSGHDYAGAVLYPGAFPFVIREKVR